MVFVIIQIVVAVVLMAEMYQIGFHNGVIQGLDEAVEEMERSQNGIQGNFEREQ